MSGFRVVTQPFSAKHISDDTWPHIVDFKTGEHLAIVRRDGSHTVFALKSDVDRPDRLEYILDSKMFGEVTKGL